MVIIVLVHFVLHCNGRAASPVLSVTQLYAPKYRGTQRDPLSSIECVALRDRETNRASREGHKLGLKKERDQYSKIRTEQAFWISYDSENSADKFMTFVGSRDSFSINERPNTRKKSAFALEKVIRYLWTGHYPSVPKEVSLQYYSVLLTPQFPELRPPARRTNQISDILRAVTWRPEGFVSTGGGIFPLFIWHSVAKASQDLNSHKSPRY